jgi:hypothetical protein
MIERINARDDTACTVTEQKHRQTRVFRFCSSDERRHVVGVVFDLFDVVTLTFERPRPRKSIA